MKNYATVEQVADLAQRPATEVQQDYLDWVDAEIEQYTGQGYKGAERFTALIGEGNRYLKLPSKADALVSVYENGTLLDPSAYRFRPGSRLVERITNYPGYYGTMVSATWLDDVTYEVTYTEPNVPLAQYGLVAAQAGAVIVMFKKKHKEFGIAITASDSGTAGKVSSSASTSFPQQLIEEVRKVIAAGLRKPAL